MCTALTLNMKDHYFGRTLDLDRSYGEEICVMPRNFPLIFRKVKTFNNHFAIIGMATVVNDIPLYYDATNEFGLSMAGLNFPGNAYYSNYIEGKDNITPFEFIPWILGCCKNIDDAKRKLNKINLVNIPFSDELTLSPLHWIIADSNSSIVVEFMKDGMHMHNNEIGILTNNPPFEYQIKNLEKYNGLRNDNKKIDKNENTSYISYSQGLGAVGLPGDVSSMSRFVRIAFAKKYTIYTEDELTSVAQFFHLLTSVSMIKGACKTDHNTFDNTEYISCVNTKKGLYYYITYNNRQINCIDMHKTNLDSDTISRFPLILKENVNYQN